MKMLYRFFFQCFDRKVIPSVIIFTHVRHCYSVYTIEGLSNVTNILLHVDTVTNVVTMFNDTLFDTAISTFFRNN